MKLKVDENLPVEAAELLCQAGHDAVTVPAQGLGGAPDSVLADRCRREHRVLVTLDTGFADIRAYPPQEYPGLVVLRLGQQNKPHVLDVLRRLISVPATESPTGCLWIVETDRIRVRGRSDE